MSKQWWELAEDEIAEDREAQRARQHAYASIFYSTTDGNHVLLDIKHCCQSNDVGYEGRVVLLRLYNTIRKRAGASVYSELAMIEAEANTLEFETLEEEEGDQ